MGMTGTTGVVTGAVTGAAASSPASLRAAVALLFAPIAVPMAAPAALCLASILLLTVFLRRLFYELCRLSLRAAAARNLRASSTNTSSSRGDAIGHLNATVFGFCGGLLLAALRRAPPDPGAPGSPPTEAPPSFSSLFLLRRVRRFVSRRLREPLGLSAGECKAARCFTLRECHETAVFTLKACRRAGFTAADCAAAADSYATSAGTAGTAGASADGAVGDPYSLQRCKDAGFSSEECFAAGVRDAVKEAAIKDWRVLGSVVGLTKGEAGGGGGGGSTGPCGDKVFMLRIFELKRNGLALEYASAALKGDKDVVRKAVQWSGRALLYASPNLRNDRDVVMEAVQQNWGALEYASAELKGDEGVVRAAVQQDRAALKHASTELKRTLSAEHRSSWSRYFNLLCSGGGAG
jgi:hypothetical protein